MSIFNLVSASGWLPGVVNSFRTISLRPKAAVGDVEREVFPGAYLFKVTEQFMYTHTVYLKNKNY